MLQSLFIDVLSKICPFLSWNYSSTCSLSRERKYKIQFHFTAQKANSHSAIPFHLPSPILPACELGILGVQSFKCLCCRKLQFWDSAMWQLVLLSVCVKCNLRDSSERANIRTLRVLPHLRFNRSSLSGGFSQVQSIFWMGTLYPHLGAVKGFSAHTCSFPLRAPGVSVPRLILTFPSDVPFLHI